MNRRQLDRLARVLEAMVPPARCKTCGGPEGAFDAVIVVEHDGTPCGPTCPACGLSVDSEGRARLRQFDPKRRHRVVIRLDKCDGFRPGSTRRD